MVEEEEEGPGATELDTPGPEGNSLIHEPRTFGGGPQGLRGPGVLPDPTLEGGAPSEWRNRLKTQHNICLSTSEATAAERQQTVELAC